MYDIRQVIERTIASAKKIHVNNKWLVWHVVLVIGVIVCVEVIVRKKTFAQFVPLDFQYQGLRKRCVFTADTPTTENGQQPLFSDSTDCEEITIVNEEWYLGFQSEYAYGTFCPGFPAINGVFSPVSFNWIDRGDGTYTARMVQDYLTYSHPCGAGHFNWYVLMKRFNEQTSPLPLPYNLQTHHTVNYTINKANGSSRLIAGIAGFKRNVVGGVGEQYGIEVSLYKDADWGDNFLDDPVLIAQCALTEEGEQDVCGAEFVFVDGSFFGYQIEPSQEEPLIINWGQIFEYLISNGYLQSPVSPTLSDVNVTQAYLGYEVQNYALSSTYYAELYQADFSMEDMGLASPSPSPGESPIPPEGPPSPIPSPSVEPSPLVSPDPSPNPSPDVTPSPEISPSPLVSPEPSPSPSPDVTPSPEISPSPLVSPEPSPSPSPVATNQNTTTTSHSFSPAYPPSCSNPVPVGTPDLFQINRTSNSVKLYFTPVNNVDRYHVVYGFKLGEERFGMLSAPVAREANLGVQSITIDHLSRNREYWFKIVPVNGCAVGSWSNWLGAGKGGWREKMYYRVGPPRFR